MNGFMVETKYTGKYRIAPYKMGRYVIQREFQKFSGKFYRYGFLALKKKWVQDTEPYWCDWEHVYHGEGYALFDKPSDAKEFIDRLIADEEHMKQEPLEYP